MNGFLALGNNEQIYHSLDGVTWTPAHYLLNGMQLSVVADDGAGNLVTGPVGGAATNKLLTSHDDGVSWAVTFTSPVAPGTILNASFSGGLHFYLNASNNAFTQAGNAVWDGGQFVLVGINTSFPFVDMFSLSGGSWQVWAQTTDSTPGPETFYVPDDLLFFGGVYVGIVAGGGHPSLIWSPTAGKNAGPISPAPQTDWTVGLAINISTSDFFKTNGAYILAFGLFDGGGDSIVAKSTDGKNWTQSAPLNGLFVNNGKDSVWWDPTLNLWCLCGGDNGGNGLFTSVDGLVWTPRIYDPTFTISLYSVRRTGWFLSAVGLAGAFYISIDGETWTKINAACPTIADPWDLSFIHSRGNYFIALGTQVNSPFQTALVTSPNGTVWTPRQNINSPDSIYNLIGPSAGDPLTSYINPCTGKPEFAPASLNLSGALVGFTFNEEQGVTAWHRHPMIGAVEAIACIPAPSKSQDDLWMIVNRTINGVTKRYVEYMAPHFVAGDDLVSDALYSDCGVTSTGAPRTVVTGLGYLEGQTVKVLTDGALHPDCVVTGGQITLQWKASIVQVGLPQTCRLTTMPIDIQGGGGSVAGKIKRVSDLSVRFANAIGGKIGIEDPNAELSDPPHTVMDDLEMREPADAMDGPVAVHNGLWPEETYGFNYPAGYEVEGRITYVNEEPYPVTIVGIYPNIEVED